MLGFQKPFMVSEEDWFDQSKHILHDSLVVMTKKTFFCVCRSGNLENWHNQKKMTVLVNEKVVPVCLCRSSEGVDRQGLKKVLPTDHPYVASGKQTLIHSPPFFHFIKIVFFRSRLKNILPPIGGWNILWLFLDYREKYFRLTMFRVIRYTVRCPEIHQIALWPHGYI